MTQSDSFAFACCQQGAEAALKAEIGRLRPSWRFAFSRPGFVTFKLPAPAESPGDFDVPAVFARCLGVCLGKVQGGSGQELAAAFWERVGVRPYDRLHVWQRDPLLPGQRGFEPGISPLAEEAARLLVASRPAGQQPDPLPVNRPARRGQTILDCILVEPDQWWVGWHVATSRVRGWPGGIWTGRFAAADVSRAALKVQEALAWSNFPLRAGQTCVEIGSAPGGACQVLLERGLRVIGIDPAEMDPQVLEHPAFTHVRKRAAEVPRRDFRRVDWLFADSNVAPRHTLDTVESIVTHRQVHIRGLLLTLKLPDWSLAEQLESYLQRVRSWGFRHVRARQLAFNRQEICLAALRRPSQRRERSVRHSSGTRASEPQLGGGDPGPASGAPRSDAGQPSPVSETGAGET